MMRFRSAVAVVLIASSANAFFSPNPNDTAVISFDTLHLGKRWGDIASFTYNWGGEPVHKDSITWSIDGALPGENASVQNGPNPRDLSPDYSTGTTLTVSAHGDPLLFQGIHRVDVAVRFGDSTKTGTWFFKCCHTRYLELRARLIIDSFWTTYSTMQGYYNFAKYKIDSLESFDTSLFGSAFCPGPSLSIESDTGGVMRDYVAEKVGFASPVARDTDDCFIIQILRGDAVHNEWLISDSAGTWLKELRPPFALSAALQSCNAYIDAHHIYKGYCPSAGPLKLGPLFVFTVGDPGWLLKAHHDAEFWYLTLKTGSGDCPCGCTEWRTELYRVAADGSVDCLTSAIAGRGPGAVNGAARCTAAPRTVYSLQGRRLGNQQRLPALGKGRYIIPGLNKKEKTIVPGDRR